MNFWHRMMSRWKATVLKYTGSSNRIPTSMLIVCINVVCIVETVTSCDATAFKVIYLRPSQILVFIVVRKYECLGLRGGRCQTVIFKAAGATPVSSRVTACGRTSIT